MPPLMEQILHIHHNLHVTRANRQIPQPRHPHGRQSTHPTFIFAAGEGSLAVLHLHARRVRGDVESGGIQSLVRQTVECRCFGRQTEELWLSEAGFQVGGMYAYRAGFQGHRGAVGSLGSVRSHGTRGTSVVDCITPCEDFACKWRSRFPAYFAHPVHLVYLTRSPNAADQKDTIASTQIARRMRQKTGADEEGMRPMGRELRAQCNPLKRMLSTDLRVRHTRKVKMNRRTLSRMCLSISSLAINSVFLSLRIARLYLGAHHT
jgi:hypothetical protein